MKPERWQQIDQLFHSTLGWPPPERANFLSQECAGDEDLRREVESLLHAHERDGDFLNTPAYEVSTELFVDCLTGLLAGQQIGHYKILSLLGIGGMGEVYLAQDGHLGRNVALKLLSPDFARDPRRVLRFKQEARAASALNHPNVCVIHEIAETDDGRHFIAMEHIDGVTLRERIARRPFGVREALAIADQIAAALSTAHAAGVVHRDIKPENIMLRKDGYVKVLDFGLAKLNETEPLSRGDTSSTISIVHTEPGTQMGTVKYMSPEQLREGVVDERTDIWSLGVVLHEMVTERTPFEEGSRNETIASILKRQPARLTLLDGAVPVEFQRIVARTLSKQCEGRYLTMSGLAADLKKLRGQLGADVPGDLWLMDHDVSADEQDTKRVRIKGPGQTSLLWSSALTFASRKAEQVFGGIKERPKTTIFAGLAVAVAIFIAFNSRPIVNRPKTAAPLQVTRMIPLTTSGKSVCAAISPDGKYVAHAEDRNGFQQLIVTRVAAGDTPLVVSAPSRVMYRGIAFSRDGNHLYFSRNEEGEGGVLYQVALPAGVPQKIKDGVDSPVTFSPKGDRFAFVRFKKASGEYFLMLANIDGTEERTIAARRDGNRFSLDGAAWSPDEKTIVCGAAWWDNGYHMNLVEVDTADGHEKPISSRQQWFGIYQVAWLGDKSALIVNAREHPLDPAQLWQVSYPDGETSGITNDTIEYRGASLSRDVNSIVSVQSRQTSQIWLERNEDDSSARAIATKAGLSYGLGLSWTGDGRILFSSMSRGNLNISAIDSYGFHQTQLTVNAGDNYTPVTSSDGRLILFSSNRKDGFNIWRMNAADGSDPKQLTFTDGNFYPACSPDGQWIFYENQNKGTLTIWKVPVGGGAPVPVTDKYARMPVISPDNQFIACRYYIAAGKQGIAIIPVGGGSPVKLLPIPVMEWQRIQWLSGGEELSYLDMVDGTSNIWSYDLSTGSKKQLTNFKTGEIFAYAWSPDGKHLASERGTKTSDVTIVDFQR